MSGVLANSVSKTMVAGDTAADQSVSGYLALEQIALSTTPTGSSWAWSVAKPSSSGASAKFNSTTAWSPTFTPDVEGFFTFTCVVDGVTVYVLRVAVLAIGSVTTLSVERFSPLNAAQVPTPPLGESLFCDSTNGGRLSAMDSTRTVRVVENTTQQCVLDTVLGAFDANSIITGDITQPEWRDLGGNSPPYSNIFVYPNQALTQDGTYLSAHQLNATQAAATQGRLNTLFWLPFAATWNFNVPAAVPSGTSTIKLVLYATDQATPVASQVFTVTATEQTFTLSYSEYTPGFQYMAEIQVNDTGQQANPYIGRVSFTPSTFAGTGIFSAPWKRIRIHGGMLNGTSYMGQWSLGQFFNHSPHVDVSFLSDTTELGTECYQVNGDGLIGCIVDGLELPPLAAMGIKITTQLRTLPPSLPRAVRNVTIRAGMAGGQQAGTYLRAVYLQATAYFVVPTVTTTNKFCLVSDSIGNGSGATTPIYQSWIARVKKRYPGTTIVDAWPGRTFYVEANTTPLQKAFALKLAQLHVTDLWIALGTNDYATSVWTAAALGTAFAAFLDFFHGMSPATRVWCQTPIVKSPETANGVGDTLGAYRTQIQNAATDASRAPWAFYVDGTGGAGVSAGFWPVLGDLPDFLHPNNGGHGKIGQAVILELNAANALG